MFFLPLKLQGCKNEILNYDSCTKPKLIIGPRRFLFLKHWMRNERHQALQRGSLREVSRVASFLGKSRSEEESVFISPLPVTSSRPFRRHNRSARKSLTRGKVCDLFFSIDVISSTKGAEPLPVGRHAPDDPSFHPCPLTALRLPFVRAPAHPVFPDTTTRSPPAPPPTVQPLLLAIRKALDEG